MTHTYTVQLRRPWDERYTITVEAATPGEALQKANLDEDHEEFNWNHVEASEREVLCIDDDQTGEQVYAVDAEPTPSESACLRDDQPEDHDRFHGK